jgi:hypothetical protein
MMIYQSRQSEKDALASLSPVEIQSLKDLANHSRELFKAKADVADLILLRENKTNKQDTERCERSIEMMHRMLQNLAMLMIEA